MQGWSLKCYIEIFFFSARVCLHVVCGIYYSICTQWNCIINMNVHNLRHMKNNASTHFARQQAVCFWLHRERRSCFLTPVETDLVWLLQVKQGTLKKIYIHSTSDLVQIKLKNVGFFCSCVKAVCVLCIYTRAMDRAWNGLSWREKKYFLFIM